jgi:hypothetical protein
MTGAPEWLKDYLSAYLEIDVCISFSDYLSDLAFERGEYRVDFIKNAEVHIRNKRNFLLFVKKHLVLSQIS